MAENATTTAEPLSARQPLSAAAPIPGSRAHVMAACADALRAAAADVEDPRTTPLPGSGTESKRQLSVASWLRRRADLLTPPAPTAWERNAAQLVEARWPDVPAQLRRTIAEALHGIAVQLNAYGLDSRHLVHLVDELTAAFCELHDARAVPA